MSKYTTTLKEFETTVLGSTMFQEMRDILIGAGFTNDQALQILAAIKELYWNYEISYDFYSMSKDEGEDWFSYAMISYTSRFCDYYYNLITKYLEPLDESIGTYIKTTFIDLPRSDTSVEKATNRTIEEGNENVISLRNQALRYIRNIYYEFAEKFRPCFIFVF